MIETICIISFNPYNDPVKEDTTILSLCFSDGETEAYREELTSTSSNG